MSSVDNSTFLSWVREKILATGQVEEGALFDARDKSLSWIISSKLAATLKCCVLVSLPKWNRTETQAAAKEHELSVLIVVRTTPQLNASVNGYDIACELYKALDGERFYPDARPGDRLIPNVVADALTSSGDEEKKTMSSFVVKAKIQF